MGRPEGQDDAADDADEAEEVVEDEGEVRDAADEEQSLGDPSTNLGCVARSVRIIPIIFAHSAATPPHGVFPQVPMRVARLH